MGGYSVQLAELGELIDKVAQAAERIADASAALRGAAPSDLGSAGIDRAGSAFHDRWEHGTRRIGQFSGQIVEALGQTRRDYQAVEDAIARALGGADAAPPESRIGRALGGLQ